MKRTKPVIYPGDLSGGVGYSFFSDDKACFGGDDYRHSWSAKGIVVRLVNDLRAHGMKPADVRAIW